MPPGSRREPCASDVEHPADKVRGWPRYWSFWLLIGAVAVGQRGYFGGSDTNCAKAGTIMVTIVAGPLNYMGVNPTITCQLPQPSP